MYENLVGRLRFKAGVEDFPDSIWDEAADAIEARDKAAEEWEILAESWKKACKELESRMPRWIPVTEYLPKKKRASYLCRTDGGYCKEVRWTNIRYGLVESDDWGWCIFDIPQFSHVTHWMPLPPDPEPSKEEK